MTYHRQAVLWEVFNFALTPSGRPFDSQRISSNGPVNSIETGHGAILRVSGGKVGARGTFPPHSKDRIAQR
jgi:hypothetical protein